jgi:hypothetical protein
VTEADVTLVRMAGCVTFTADNHYDHDTSSSQMSTFFPKTGARKLQKSSYFLNSINYCNIHLHKIISLHITPFCLMIYVLPVVTFQHRCGTLMLFYDFDDRQPSYQSEQDVISTS